MYILNHLVAQKVFFNRYFITAINTFMKGLDIRQYQYKLCRRVKITFYFLISISQIKKAKQNGKPHTIKKINQDKNGG